MPVLKSVPTNQRLAEEMSMNQQQMMALQGTGMNQQQQQMMLLQGMGMGMTPLQMMALQGMGVGMNQQWMTPLQMMALHGHGHGHGHEPRMPLRILRRPQAPQNPPPMQLVQQGFLRQQLANSIRARFRPAGFRPQPARPV